MDESEFYDYHGHFGLAHKFTQMEYNVKRNDDSSLPEYPVGLCKKVNSS